MADNKIEQSGFNAFLGGMFAGFFDNLFKMVPQGPVATPGGQVAAAAEPAVKEEVVTGSIGQTSFSGGSFGDFSASRFYDAQTGNSGQYSTPGGIGHAMLEPFTRSAASMTFGTPTGKASASATARDWNPFAGLNFPGGSALAPNMRAEFGQTVRNQPSRAALTGEA